METSTFQFRANGESYFTKMDLKVLTYCIEAMSEKSTHEAQKLLEDAKRAVEKEFAYIYMTSRNEQIQ